MDNLKINNIMIIVTLTKENYIEKEVNIPKGVIKEKVYDYQDFAPYFKYYYISKKGKKKLCKIKWI
jgi:hypothetical protein